MICNDDKYSYKKISKIFYVFLYDSKIIGDVFKSNDSWGCFLHEPHELNPILGFKTKRYASDFLLKLSSLKKNKERKFLKFRKNKLR